MQLLCLEVPADPGSAVLARRELGMIEELLPPPRSGDVRLLCGELMAAAIRGLDGAGTPLRLTVDLDRRRVRIEVACPGPRAPAGAAAAGDGSSYGLALLDRLADAWGMGRRRDGTRSCWCELDLAGPARA